jgi:hypothetical protein
MVREDFMLNRILAAAAPLLAFAIAAPAHAYLCGDVNGNGDITAGDALSALRLSVGQEVATSCGSQFRVLATGQTQCSDEEGDLIGCEGTGQDGELRKGAPRAFVDNGDGTVTDRATGLQWELFDDGGGLHDRDYPADWLGAFAKIAALNLASFAGHDDWRVPNISELMSIGNFGRIDPGLYLPFFQHDCTADCELPQCACLALPSYEWSSTSYVPQANMAWALQMRFGDPILQGKSLANYRARAVRGGYSQKEVVSEPAFEHSCADVNASDDLTASDALAILRGSVGQEVELTCIQRSSTLVTGQTECYSDAGLVIPCTETGQDGDLQRGIERSFTLGEDGTVTDEVTGLVWEILSDDETIHDRSDTYTFMESQTKIGALNEAVFAGRADWRLPNFFEVASLLNFGSETTGVYDAFFNFDCEDGCTNEKCSCLPATGEIWSSTSPGFHEEYALRTDLVTARTVWHLKTESFAVRGVSGGD